MFTLCTILGAGVLEAGPVLCYSNQLSRRHVLRSLCRFSSRENTTPGPKCHDAQAETVEKGETATTSQK
eukprot:CAMPEP_0185427642 /NCGR_PEP_ID=MMETSP1365-20130426/15572_1 /TAXON_ID=38817 /ORGANISM="Gephyrocapsa oceanica, Strain RCC1303" /LENGTH=68 /DNA_ID=CAMNT_0028031781 /DNA_START=1 /DNA_END=204 /DNA_ORIENTATION=+